MAGIESLQKYDHELSELLWDAGSMLLPVLDIVRAGQGLWKAETLEDTLSESMRLLFGLTTTVPVLGLGLSIWKSLSGTSASAIDARTARNRPLTSINDFGKFQKTLHRLGQYQRFAFYPFMLLQLPLNALALANGIWEYASADHATDTEGYERKTALIHIAQSVLFGATGVFGVGRQFKNAYDRAANLQRHDTRRAVLEKQEGSQMDFLETFAHHLSPGHNPNTKIKNEDIASFKYSDDYDSVKIDYTPIPAKQRKIPEYTQGRLIDNHIGAKRKTYALGIIFDYWFHGAYAMLRGDTMIYDEVVIQKATHALRKLGEKQSDTLTGMRNLLRTRSDGTSYIPNHLEAALKHTCLADFLTHRRGSALVRIVDNGKVVTLGVKDVMVIKPGIKTFFYPFVRLKNLVVAGDDPQEVRRAIETAMSAERRHAVFPGSEGLPGHTATVVRTYVEGTRTYNITKEGKRKIKTVDPTTFYPHRPGSLYYPAQTVLDPRTGQRLPVALSSSTDTNAFHATVTCHGYPVATPTGEEIPILLARGTDADRELVGKPSFRRKYGESTEAVVAHMIAVREWLAQNLVGKDYFTGISSTFPKRDGHSWALG